MRLVSVLFDGANRADYERMARVLKLSAERNSPATPIEIHDIGETLGEVGKIARPICKRTWIDNARKTYAHSEIVNGAKDGELIGFFDCDTMVLGDLSILERYSVTYDLAVTHRPKGSDWLINTGFYVVRVSPKMREWCTLWARTAGRMLMNESFHNKWRNGRSYGGINQAALGFLLECWRGAIPVSVLNLKCEEWNSTPETWKTGSPRIVHFMDHLRLCCLTGARASGERMDEYTRQWREFDCIAEKKECTV